MMKPTDNPRSVNLTKSSEIFALKDCTVRNIAQRHKTVIIDQYNDRASDTLHAVVWTACERADRKPAARVMDYAIFESKGAAEGFLKEIEPIVKATQPDEVCLIAGSVFWLTELFMVAIIEAMDRNLAARITKAVKGGNL